MGSQVLGVYVYGLFFEYTGLEFLNYLSIFLAVLVYWLVMRKFLRANRVVPKTATA